MKRLLFTALTLTALAAGSGSTLAQEKAPVFGTLEPASAEATRAKAQAWLKEVGKTDPATLERFNAIWKQDERAVFDRLIDTFVLGSKDAADLLSEARSPVADAPVQVPALLTDAKVSPFFRANLALAYARGLNGRRVHEEALEVLKQFKGEQVVDPAAFFFHRAISEHSLLQKKDATDTIFRLLEEVTGAAERFKVVSALMLVDMQTWKEKDLGAVARKMENVERRLDLARGGPQTQKLQKEIIARLDELIKELENKAKQKKGGGGGGGGGGGPPNDGACPGGEQPGGSGPPKDVKGGKSPATESGIAGGKTTGEADPFKNPPKNKVGIKSLEREQEERGETAGPIFSPRHRLAIESYYRKLNESAGRK